MRTGQQLRYVIASATPDLRLKDAVQMALILSPDVGITAQPGKLNGAGWLDVASPSVAQTIALRLPASHALSGGEIA
ncbi:hypothetical protein D3C78_819080 [compost metagenome]